VHSDPEILLIDEVLAVGDAAFQEKCLAKMQEFRSRGITIVLVSHSMELVEEFCQRALLLNGGRVVVDGSTTDVVERYREMISHPEAALETA
jgi:ABC-2 type transport system ATP-binding protein